MFCTKAYRKNNHGAGAGDGSDGGTVTLCKQ